VADDKKQTDEADEREAAVIRGSEAMSLITSDPAPVESKASDDEGSDSKT
jgi:hypothetical protein